MIKPIVKLVWDNANPDIVNIPSEMGEPRADQMQGTALERLAELCGRICYDSLGKGRNSEEYHRHIKEVGHLSVWEHCTRTVEVENESLFFNDGIAELFNKPSLWADCSRLPRRTSRITMNARHVHEWQQSRLGGILRRTWAAQTPQMIEAPSGNSLFQFSLPATDNERWVSLYIGNVSRNLTHELVRHGDWTAFSQRSTRYCDEGSTPAIWHPALGTLPADVQHLLDMDRIGASLMYKTLVDTLTASGHDRKTARGAARGVLPSALGTELIMSASVAQWKHILRLRGDVAADQEIQNLSAAIAEVVK